MSNSERQDGNETYGDGKTRDQTDYAKAALRNQNRFEPDREPRGHNGLGGIEADKAKG